LLVLAVSRQPLGRPTGAYPVLVMYVAKALVRGPRPTEYCYGELRVVPAPEAEVRSVASPFEFIPPVRVVPGSGARGNHPFSGDEVTIVRTPPIRVMLDED
jgi:hypothetical protein